MAWVAGADKVVSDLITAATWNNYMGATGSMEYLKPEFEKLDDITVDTSPSRAMDTNYRYTGGGMLFVLVTLTLNTGEEMNAKIGSASPATVQADALTNSSGGNMTLAVCFTVPDNWYYLLTNVGGSSCTLVDWVEWDMH
ncbi:hypothetical protein CMI37_13955 [Candidatus Pacearchaeota archaeon]|nr:hypothetical protein [Candidatus Pacearchaeota archaeon]|tara:strand:- start:4441 stop:4860 length:420 start_codon:yes stop_codon:yes gene_type:complete